MRTRFLLLALLLWPGRAVADERWYIFSIADTPVGWVSEETDGLRSRTLVQARLTRLGKSIDMRFVTATTEDDRGSLRTLEYEALLSKQPLRVSVRVEGERVVILTPPHERTIERGPEPLLGPIAIARLTQQHLRSERDEVEYRTFSPEFQRVVKVRRRVLRSSEPTPCGGAAAMRIEELVEGLPTPRTLWLDAAATMVGDTVAGPFGPMSTCRAPKDAALAASGTLPADVYERTLARSNVRFADPSAIDRLVVRIRQRDPAVALPDFAAHNQRRAGPDLIEISRPVRAATTAPPPAREYLEANALVESTHPDIAAVAKSVSTKDPFATALALTRWTAENLTMDAGIVMAPASELIRDRRATCMGYATLLAALARAAGLPSRVVMGYVYYGGIWGGHAWTDIFVDGRWLPFDAAVFAPAIASAARISVGTSSLADGGGSLTGPLSALFGRVDVEITEYEQDGRLVRVPRGAVPFAVQGSRYVSDGLGVRLEAPGWIIERAGATWPSTLVVAFRRGAAVIELHQKARYPERPLSLDGDAVFASIDRGTLWVWTARGSDAAAALPAFLARLERVR